MDVVEIMKFLLTSAIAILPSIFVLYKSKAEVRKTISESHQIDSDVQNEKERLLLEAKRTDVEVAERLIKSVGDLIEHYKDMINTFSNRIIAQEEKISLLSGELRAEVKKREKLEKTWKELFAGVKKLLVQLEENKIDPVWKPKTDMDETEE